MRSGPRDRRLGPWFALCALTLLAALPGWAQGPPAKAGGATPAPPKVFMDWPGGDVAGLAAEVPFAEFVTSREDAQILVAVSQGEAEGREVFTLAFSGRKEFQGDDNTLTYTARPEEAREETCKALAGLVKIGLVRYAAKTPLAKHLAVRFQDEVKPTAVADKWDFWVFNLSANAFLMGETQYRSGMYYGSFSANRVTPEFKLRTSFYGNTSKMRFDLGDSVYESSSHGAGFSGLAVKSLSGRWSAGAYLSVQSSTYSNLKLSGSIAPAVEFNVFPYSESTKRQLRILYRIGVARTAYHEETLYFKTAETLFQESLEVAFEVKRPWGTAGLEIEGSHYLHDLGKNRLEIEGNVSFRIWKGLNLEFGGGYTRIRDQLALPRGGASYEEVLLRQKQLATGYAYNLSVGLNFTFGSTRSQVVNPRFGSGGRGISISM
jgi:hypothetical protein